MCRIHSYKALKIRNIYNKLTLYSKTLKICNSGPVLIMKDSSTRYDRISRQNNTYTMWGGASNGLLHCPALQDEPGTNYTSFRN